MNFDLHDRYMHKIKTAIELDTILRGIHSDKRTVMCHGVFDVVHPGHIRHLLFAKSKDGYFFTSEISGFQNQVEDYINIISDVNTTFNITTTGNVSGGNIKTDNLLYANGTPWDLQQAAGSNNQIQFNENNDFSIKRIYKGMLNTNENKIPKIIHQLWIGSKPPPINLMNTWKNKNPDFEYICWTEEEMIKRNMG